MIYATVETSPVCVLPGVPRIREVIVKLVAALIVYESTPRVVVELAATLIGMIISVEAIFVFETVTVPLTKVADPIKSVTAPPCILICFAAPLSIK